MTKGEIEAKKGVGQAKLCLGQVLVVRTQGSSKRRNRGPGAGENTPRVRGPSLQATTGWGGARKRAGLNGERRYTGTGAGFSWERAKGLEQGRSLKWRRGAEFRTGTGCVGVDGV